MTAVHLAAFLHACKEESGDVLVLEGTIDTWAE